MCKQVTVCPGKQGVKAGSAHWHIQVSVTAQGKGSLAGLLLLAHIHCHD